MANRLNEDYSQETYEGNPSYGIYFPDLDRMQQVKNIKNVFSKI